MVPIAFRVKTKFPCKALCDVALLTWPYSPPTLPVFSRNADNKSCSSLKHFMDFTKMLLLSDSSLLCLLSLLIQESAQILTLLRTLPWPFTPSCPHGTLGKLFLTLSCAYLCFVTSLLTSSDSKLLEDQNAIFLMIVSLYLAYCLS